MLEKKIKELREKLEKSIIEGQKYDETYKISVELDTLIAKYYTEKKLKINKKPKTQFA